MPTSSKSEPQKALEPSAHQLIRACMVSMHQAGQHATAAMTFLHICMLCNILSSSCRWQVTL